MQKSDILKFLADHKDEIKNNYGVIRIGLCGSYVRNENGPDSDIDLVIEIEPQKKDIHNYLALKRMLEESFHAKVDLGIENALKPIVKEHILKEIQYV